MTTLLRSSLANLAIGTNVTTGDAGAPTAFNYADTTGGTITRDQTPGTMLAMWAKLTKTAATACALGWNFATTSKQGGGHIYWWLDALPPADRRIGGITTATPTVYYDLWCTPLGALKILNNSGSLVWQSSNGVVSPKTIYDSEMFHDCTTQASGIWKLNTYLFGSTTAIAGASCNVTGIATGAGNLARIYAGSFTSGDAASGSLWVADPAGWEGTMTEVGPYLPTTSRAASPIYSRKLNPTGWFSALLDATGWIDEANDNPTIPGRGLALWFSAEDLLNTYADGASVAAWPCRVCNMTLGESTLNKPVFKTNIANGLPAVRFTSGATSSRLSLANPPLMDNANGGTIFVVYKSTATNPNYAAVVITENGTVSGNERMSIYGVPTTNYLAAYGRLLDSDSLTSKFSSTAQPSAVGVLRLESKWASGTYNFALNGSSIGSGAWTSSGTTSNTPSLAFRLGCSTTATQGLDGDIHEVIVYERTLSAAEITQVETYLTSKWMPPATTITPATVAAPGVTVPSPTPAASANALRLEPADWLISTTPWENMGFGYAYVATTISIVPGAVHFALLTTAVQAPTANGAVGVRVTNAAAGYRYAVEVTAKTSSDGPRWRALVAYSNSSAWQAANVSATQMIYYDNPTTQDLIFGIELEGPSNGWSPTAWAEIYDIKVTRTLVRPPTVTIPTPTISTGTNIAAQTLRGSYAAAVLADAPLVYYRLGEPSGTSMVDSSGNGRNGSYVVPPTLGTTGLITGDADTAATFTGGTYGDGPTGAWNAQATPTAIAWLNLSSKDWIQEFLSHDDEGSNRLFQFRTNASNQIEFIFWLTSGGLKVLTGNTPIGTNARHMAAFTYDGTTATVYLDGQPDGSASYSPDTMLTSSYTLGLRLGCSAMGGGGVQGYQGVMDEVSYYGTALSAARIAALYTAGTTAPTLAATIPTPTVSTGSTIAAAVVAAPGTTIPLPARIIEPRPAVVAPPLVTVPAPTPSAGVNIAAARVAPPVVTIPLPARIIEPRPATVAPPLVTVPNPTPSAGVNIAAVMVFGFVGQPSPTEATGSTISVAPISPPVTVIPLPVIPIGPATVSPPVVVIPTVRPGPSPATVAPPVVSIPTPTVPFVPPTAVIPGVSVPAPTLSTGVNIIATTVAPPLVTVPAPTPSAGLNIAAVRVFPPLVTVPAPTPGGGVGILPNAVTPPNGTVVFAPSSIQHDMQQNIAAAVVTGLVGQPSPAESTGSTISAARVVAPGVAVLTAAPGAGCGITLTSISPSIRGTMDVTAAGAWTATPQVGDLLIAIYETWLVPNTGHSATLTFTSTGWSYDSATNLWYRTADGTSYDNNPPFGFYTDDDEFYPTTNFVATYAVAIANPGALPWTSAGENTTTGTISPTPPSGLFNLVAINEATAAQVAIADPSITGMTKLASPAYNNFPYSGINQTFWYESPTSGAARTATGLDGTYQHIISTIALTPTNAVVSAVATVPSPTVSAGVNKLAATVAPPLVVVFTPTSVNVGTNKAATTVAPPIVTVPLPTVSIGSTITPACVVAPGTSVLSPTESTGQTVAAIPVVAPGTSVLTAFPGAGQTVAAPLVAPPVTTIPLPTFSMGATVLPAVVAPPLVAVPAVTVSNGQNLAPAVVAPPLVTVPLPNTSASILHNATTVAPPVVAVIRPAFDVNIAAVTVAPPLVTVPTPTAFSMGSNATPAVVAPPLVTVPNPTPSAGTNIAAAVVAPPLVTVPNPAPGAGQTIPAAMVYAFVAQPSTVESAGAQINPAVVVAPGTSVYAPTQISIGQNIAAVTVAPPLVTVPNPSTSANVGFTATTVAPPVVTVPKVVIPVMPQTVAPPLVTVPAPTPSAGVLIQPAAVSPPVVTVPAPLVPIPAILVVAIVGVPNPAPAASVTILAATVAPPLVTVPAPTPAAGVNIAPAVVAPPLVVVPLPTFSTGSTLAPAVIAPPVVTVPQPAFNVSIAPAVVVAIGAVPDPITQQNVSISATTVAPPLVTVPAPTASSGSTPTPAVVAPPIVTIPAVTQVSVGSNIAAVTVLAVANQPSPAEAAGSLILAVTVAPPLVTVPAPSALSAGSLVTPAVVAPPVVTVPRPAFNVSFVPGLVAAPGTVVPAPTPSASTLVAAALVAPPLAAVPAPGLSSGAMPTPAVVAPPLVTVPALMPNVGSTIAAAMVFGYAAQPSPAEAADSLILPPTVQAPGTLVPAPTISDGQNITPSVVTAPGTQVPTPTPSAGILINAVTVSPSPSIVHPVFPTANLGASPSTVVAPGTTVPNPAPSASENIAAVTVAPPLVTVPAPAPHAGQTVAAVTVVAVANQPSPAEAAASLVLAVTVAPPLVTVPAPALSTSNTLAPATVAPPVVTVPSPAPAANENIAAVCVAPPVVTVPTVTVGANLGASPSTVAPPVVTIPLPTVSASITVTATTVAAAMPSIDKAGIYFPGPSSFPNLNAPDAAALDILGDIDVRAQISLASWTNAAVALIMDGANAGDPNRRWRFQLNTSGVLQLSWYPLGTAASALTATATVALTGFTAGAPLWVRAALDVDNGASGNTTTFYTSQDGVTWTPLGSAVVKAGTTSMSNVTGGVTWGTSSVPITLWRGQVYNGIAGSLVLDVDFTAESTAFRAGQNLSFTAITGQTITWSSNLAGLATRRVGWHDVATGETVAAATVVSVGNQPSPTEAAGATILPSRVIAIADVPAPTTANGTTIAASTVTALVAVPDPALSTSSTLSPAVVAPPLVTVPAPTVNTTGAVLPSTVLTVTNVYAPTISTGMTVAAVLVPVPGVAVPSPTIGAGVGILPLTVVAIGNVLTATPASMDVVTPALVTAPGTTVYPPGVSTSITLTAILVAAPGVVVPTPTVRQDQRILADTVTTVLTMPDPTVSASCDVLALTVTGSAAVAAPSIALSAIPTPACVVAVGNVRSPSVSAGASIAVTPTTVTATAAVTGWHVNTGCTVTAGSVHAPGATVPDPTPHAGMTIAARTVGVVARMHMNEVSAGSLSDAITAQIYAWIYGGDASAGSKATPTIPVVGLSDVLPIEEMSTGSNLLVDLVAALATVEVASIAIPVELLPDPVITISDVYGATIVITIPEGWGFFI